MTELRSRAGSPATRTPTLVGNERVAPRRWGDATLVAQRRRPRSKRRDPFLVQSQAPWLCVSGGRGRVSECDLHALPFAIRRVRRGPRRRLVVQVHRLGWRRRTRRHDIPVRWPSRSPASAIAPPAAASAATSRSIDCGDLQIKSRPAPPSFPRMLRVTVGGRRNWRPSS